MRPSGALLRRFKFGKSVFADVTFRPRIRGSYELLRNVFRPWLRGDGFMDTIKVPCVEEKLRRSQNLEREKEQKGEAHRFHGR